MSIIDLILNIAAVLLWIHWIPYTPPQTISLSSVSIISTLKRAEPAHTRWYYLGSLVVLLIFRGFIYWQVGEKWNWNPSIDLTAIQLIFRSDRAVAIFVFSVISFLGSLGIFYFYLLFFSIVNQSLPENDPQQRWIRFYLGWVARLPAVLKLILPGFLIAIIWLVVHPILVRGDWVPHSKSTGELLEQSLLIGATVYLLWKYLIVGLLLLHVVNSYVYFGNLPVMHYVKVTAQRLLWPLDKLPLKLGRIDLGPFVWIALIVLLTMYASKHAPGLFQKFQ